MVYNLRKRAVMAKSGEALKGVQEKEDHHDGAVVDCPKAKEFSSLPPHLQELVLSKTSTKTRMKLFQVNERLREWVFEEGLFPRDVQRIETAYRPKRPREEIASNDSLRIFKILPRSGFADNVEIDVAEAKRTIAFKNIRSCRDLRLPDWSDYFRIADFFPNLRSLGTFDLHGFYEAHFEALLEGTCFEVTLALNVPMYFDWEEEFYDEKLFEWIDKYASRCPSINFEDSPFEATVEFLETRKFRFIEYSIDSTEEDRGVVEMILKNGIPGEHPDPCIKMEIGLGFMIHVISSISRNDSLVVGDSKRIQKKFKDHSAEVGWSFDDSVFGSNAVGFTGRFDESKNLIFLLFENNSGYAELLIKYELIEKLI